MNKNYQIVIVSNGQPDAPYFCLEQFFKSLAGEQIIVLGNDFPNFHLSDRPRILYNAFQQGVITAPKVLFCDSWDLVFVDKPKILFDKWEAMECDLAVSAEKNCFPGDYVEQFDKAAPEGTSYKYINCGTILGHSEAFYETLKSMDAPNQPSDYRMGNGQMFHFNEQKYWHEEWIKQPVNIKIDYAQNIAQCLQDVRADELEFMNDGRIRNIEQNAFPSIQHFNGGSKTAGLREPILKHLNLL